MKEESQVKKELQRVGIVTGALLGILLVIWVVDLKSDVIENLGKALARLAHLE